MTRPNVISIEVTTTDKAGLKNLAREAQRVGKEIEEGLGKGFENAERKTTQSADKMSTAFKGSVSAMTRELDKLERKAALSGDGMSAGYSDALAKVRGDLATVSEEASKTGRNFDEGLSGAMRSIERAIAELRPAVQKVDKTFDATARSAERDLQRIEQQAWESGRGMDKAFSTAMDGLKQDLGRIRAEAARSGAGLESELGGALKRVREQANKLREDLNDTGGGSGAGDLMEQITGGLGLDFGGVGDMLKGGAGAAAGGAIAAGAMIGKFVWDGISSEMEEDRIGALITAQTGAASSKAEMLGDVAGNVFTDAFGESIQDVGEAMSSLFENRVIDTSAPEAAIERVTKKVLTLTATTGESADDLSESTNRILVNGLAGNVSAAMDMIQHAQEKGLNASEDLLDTITEYSTKFRDLGLSGQESFGLIEQAMEGGARNTDIAADALKEFAIRAQDGSVLTRRGFETIGLDADRMGQMVAQGGKTAHDALRQTLNALQQMPPGVARSTAAVDLFGTKAEDLGEALYHMDLDSAADEFGEFGGSVEKAAQKIAAGQTGVDKFNKTVDRLKGLIGELFDTSSSSDSFWDFNVFDGLADTEQQINEINLAKEKFLSTGDTSFLDDLIQKYPEAADGIRQYIEEHKGEIDVTNDANSAAQGYIETLDQLIGKKQEMAGVVLDLAAADMNYQEALDSAAASMEKNGETLDTTTAAGRENRKSLDDIAESALAMAESMSNSGKSVEEVNEFLNGASSALIDTADKMGMSRDEAVAYAISLGLIPNSVSTYMSLLGYEYAAARAIQFKNFIDNIPNEKTTYLRVSAQGGGHYFAGNEHGGIATRPHWSAATGGQRHSSTMINEAGPEVAELPNGTRMLTAGATRALAESGAFGGGGPTQIILSMDNSDELSRVILRSLRVTIKDDHGGSVTAALGQRGAA